MIQTVLGLLFMMCEGNNIHTERKYIFEQIQTTVYKNVNGSLTQSNQTICDPNLDPEKKYQELIRFYIPDKERIVLVNFIVCTIFIGTICGVGLIGNTLSIIVLRKDRSRSTTNFVLQVLAVADSLLLVDCFLYLSLQPVYFYTGALKEYNDQYFYMLPYLFPLGIMAQTITNWLVVVVTVERFIVVCWPFKASRWCTLPKVKRAVALILILGLIYNIPRFFEWGVRIEIDICSNYTATSFMVQPLRTRLVYKIVYRVLSYIIFVAVGPMIILTVLNFKLIQALRKATKERMQLTRSTQTQTSNTTIIVVVVSVFIICQTPALIHQIIEANDISVDSSITSYTTPLSNMLVTLNSSTNFFIYCLFGQKFRRILLKMFCNKQTPIGARSFASTTTNSMYTTAKFTAVTHIGNANQPHHEHFNDNNHTHKDTGFD